MQYHNRRRFELQFIPIVADSFFDFLTCSFSSRPLDRSMHMQYLTYMYIQYMYSTYDIYVYINLCIYVSIYLCIDISPSNLGSWPNLARSVSWTDVTSHSPTDASPQKWPSKIGSAMPDCYLSTYLPAYVHAHLIVL